MTNEKKGFTLAELLIVVAIIGVLVAISIPIFTTQLEKSRQAVDMSNMRNAYAVLSADINSGEKQKDVKYYYDAASSSLADTRPAGYGEASTESSGWWKGVGTSQGVPKGKVLEIKIDESGDASFWWGGEYAGNNVTNKTQYAALSKEEKLERDVLLLNSLQNEFRNMTYGELYDLFFEENQLKSEFRGKSYTGNNYENLVGTVKDSPYMCVTIAESTIIDNSVNTEGEKHSNKIYLSEVFQNAGYNVSGNTDENYIINSVTGSNATDNKGNGARLWVNLGITQNELKSLNSTDPRWNQKATNSFTYIKGAGTQTDPSISASTRIHQ